MFRWRFEERKLLFRRPVSGSNRGEVSEFITAFNNTYSAHIGTYFPFVYMKINHFPYVLLLLTEVILRIIYSVMYIKLFSTDYLLLVLIIKQKLCFQCVRRPIIIVTM